jgi:hypothetical protein
MSGTFSVPGVRLNAEVSKELLQTIFQTSTLLHDGAVLIRASRLVAAGVILPISERVASRQLGTRHRAAMGITERVEHCICVVVSEETGSISLAERGTLNRPFTSSKLRGILRCEVFKICRAEARCGPPTQELRKRLGQSGLLALISLVIHAFVGISGKEMTTKPAVLPPCLRISIAIACPSTWR